jgi:CheY-like chemotaxis protein
VPLNPEQAKIVALTRRTAEQGSDLVGRLLAFARRQHLSPAPVGAADVFASVGELLMHTLGGLVELQVDASNTSAPVFADRSQLELAVMNLVINARDAMPDGGVIKLSGHNRSIGAGDETGLTSGDYVVITVADTGVGIPPEILNRVLEPFFTTKEVGKGTGLGLSMVYGFARQSGGAMRIDSKIGSGTRAEIWLPRAPEHAVVPRAASSMKPRPANQRSLRLLLVDDHEVVRATTATMLIDLGHTVTHASDAREALGLLEANPDRCDLIVSDYAMPGLSGVELIRRARELRPHLPALIITGYADALAVAPVPDSIPILPKPFAFEDLSRSLDAAIKVGGVNPLDSAPEVLG